MRNLLGTLTLLAIIIGVVGFSRDWFVLSQQTEGKETEVHLRINRERIREDTKDAAMVAREVRENIEKKMADRKNEESNPWR